MNDDYVHVVMASGEGYYLNVGYSAVFVSIEDKHLTNALHNQWIVAKAVRWCDPEEPHADKHEMADLPWFSLTQVSIKVESIESYEALSPHQTESIARAKIKQEQKEYGFV